FRDAVNVRLDRGLRQRFELCPAPFPKRRCAKLNSEIPVLEFFSRRRSSRKNREIGRYILPRRYAVFRGLLLTTGPETTRDRGLVHGGCLSSCTALFRRSSGARCSLFRKSANTGPSRRRKGTLQWTPILRVETLGRTAHQVPW